MRTAERASLTAIPPPRDSEPLPLDRHPDDDRWCVELGHAIACWSGAETRAALAQGRIGPQTPVWRDGFSHWLPIGCVDELTGEDDGRISVPEQSEIRARCAPEPTLAPLGHEHQLATRAQSERAMALRSRPFLWRWLRHKAQRLRGRSWVRALGRLALALRAAQSSGTGHAQPSAMTDDKAGDRLR